MKMTLVALSLLVPLSLVSTGTTSAKNVDNEIALGNNLIQLISHHEETPNSNQDQDHPINNNKDQNKDVDQEHKQDDMTDDGADQNEQQDQNTHDISDEPADDNGDDYD